MADKKFPRPMASFDEASRKALRDALSRAVTSPTTPPRIKAARQDVRRKLS
jgi:hypothetical protein